MDVALQTKDVDEEFLKQLRKWLDDNYTPEEQERIEREWSDILQKIIMGSEIPDPTIYEECLEELHRLQQEELGSMGIDGRFYTLKQFGNDIESWAKKVPPDILSEPYGFSRLVSFYMACREKWQEYYELPTVPSSIRKQWRLEHPEVEIMFLFWGKYSSPVRGISASEAKEMARMLELLFVEFEIDIYTMHHVFADWKRVSEEQRGEWEEEYIE